MGNTPSTSAEDLTLPADMVMVTRYKITVPGRNPGTYAYRYVSHADGVVLDPGSSTKPVRRYSDSEISTTVDKEQVPIRKSLLTLAKLQLRIHEQLTNELQRQLAVN